MTAADPLGQLDGWPVTTAAAAVVGPTGVLATHGDTGHLFRLASLTKPLAALAALVAVEEGALTLDTGLGDGNGASLAVELPGATLRHLLAHASGIGPDRRQRAAAPGSRRIYSNAGFEVISDLIAAATDIDFADYLREAVFQPLQMTTASLPGSAAKDGIASVRDFAALISELLAPSGLLHPETLAAATSVQFPGLRGVLPGYGLQDPNDWGLGLELRSHKQPHWTAPENSPGTYGHFGRSGTMFWVDPQAKLGLVALTDRDFDSWAIQAWPALSTAVLTSFS
ncbi:serine hydrolase domain-containing protein [soil metagenome]|jgi:CubicO group peptidase (beta-lactamase class C family)